MKNIIQLSLIFVFALTVVTQLFAVPAYPYPISILQSDGTTLTVLMHGDEHFHYKTTADGYLIKEGNDGYHYYSRFENNQIIRTQVRVNERGMRTALESSYLTSTVPVSDNSIVPIISGRQKVAGIPAMTEGNGSFPTTGSPRSLVILVNFSDTVFVTPDAKNAFSQLLNKTNYTDNYGTGSSRDYFMQASYGKFSPHFDVVGPFNLPHTMDYYGRNNKNDNDSLPAYMVVDACKAADSAGIDFTQYDTDYDGILDNVFIYYAGHNEAEGGGANTIWPHRWSVNLNSNYAGTPNSIKFDGKKVFSYACTSELRSSTGTDMAGMGTFTHEFGHVIGLADLYHTGSSSYKVTLGRWDIMDIGVYLNHGKTPPTYSIFERFYLNWFEPTELDKALTKTLYPLSQDSVNADTVRQAYLLSRTVHNLNAQAPDPNEYFLMEYRKKTGWDTYLPDEGLIFWHIDFNVDNWNANKPNNYDGISQTAASHMGIYIQPLSGSSSTPGKPFKNGDFYPVSWSGESFNRPVTNIQMNADSITFDILGGYHAPELLVGMIRDQINFPKTSSGKFSIKTLELKGQNLTDQIKITVEGDGTFSAGLDSIAATQLQTDSGAVMKVTFQPVEAGNYQSILKLSNGGLNTERKIILNGVCE